MPERSITDAEALDHLADRYKTFGQEFIFENPESTIEAIGNLIEATGRKAWFEQASWEIEEEDA